MKRYIEVSKILSKENKEMQNTTKILIQKLT